MIPIYRTRKMEWSVNVLLRRVRHVYVRAAYINYYRVRFRADHITDDRVFFDHVPSQRESWMDEGGALISYRMPPVQEPHDAMLFVECPKLLWMIARYSRSTRLLAVVYEPPTWRAHEHQISRKFEVRSSRQSKYFKHMEQLEITKDYVSRLPEFTIPALDALLHRAQAEASRSSCAPAQCAGAAPAPDTPD